MARPESRGEPSKCKYRNSDSGDELEEEDVPVVLRPLDANSSDNVSLSATVKEVMKQLREELPEGQEQQMAVFESGGYSQAKVKSYNEVNLLWISRAQQTSTAATTALEEEDEQWQPLADGSGDSVVRSMELPQGKERWIIVRPHARLQATKEQMDKQVKKAQQDWNKRLWHLSNQAFSCPSDAHQAWKQAMKGNPSWLVTTFTSRQEAGSQQRGKPKKDAAPDTIVWHLVPPLSIDQQAVQAQIKKEACFIMATNILDEQQLAHEQIITLSKEQGGLQRGCAFSQRSPVSGCFRFCQEAGACRGIEFHHGALPVGLSLS